jgi:hypothetical protein
VPYLAERIRFETNSLSHSFNHYILAEKRLIRFYSSVHNVFNSSRIVARSIALNDSQFDDHPESDNSSSDIAQSVTNSGIPSTTLSVSALSRLRGRVHALWQWVLQKWPSVRFFFSSCYFSSVFYQRGTFLDSLREY